MRNKDKFFYLGKLNEIYNVKILVRGFFFGKNMI